LICGALRYLFNLVLYAQLWIAAGAAALAWQSAFLLSGRAAPHPYAFFIGSGALGLYILHRWVQLRRRPPHTRPYRLAQAGRFSPWLAVFFAAAIIASLFFARRLPLELFGFLALPAFIGIGYVLPVWRGRRLRDLPYTKTLWLTLAWTWLTAAAPAWLAAIPPSPWMLLERAAFIAAIALGFDIRDLRQDAAAGLATLPIRWGVARTRHIALALLALSLLSALIQGHLMHYPAPALPALASSLAVSAVLLAHASPHRPDGYFTGLLDGMLLLQPLLVWAFCLS
jgi:4-hydroxybenzoate polyprenyltransferase